MRLGGTLLADSSKGARQLLILSDGAPNRGVTTSEGLLTQTRQLVRDGVRVSAMGLGILRDQGLLARIAFTGTGRTAPRPWPVRPTFRVWRSYRVISPLSARWRSVRAARGRSRRSPFASERAGAVCNVCSVKAAIPAEHTHRTSVPISPGDTRSTSETPVDRNSPSGTTTMTRPSPDCLQGLRHPGSIRASQCAGERFLPIGDPKLSSQFPFAVSRLKLPGESERIDVVE